MILKGVDIPDALLAAQERGEVLFLCGAGVSQRVGLPSFRSLVDNVYSRLHESWLGHPAEEEAMDPPRGAQLALDRALFALAKRLGGNDPVARARADRRIMEAVTAELRHLGSDLHDHRNIARLSRDAEMRSRVVTTNFDTLFERAWPTSVAPSRAGAELPAPQTADFEGVLHLHGRVADDDLALTRTPLVLNSAEFGEAYLRSGWAARYVYDLARATTIVIVGYGADDPPMRYILEVLTADRTRYPDLRTIYAFAPSEASDQAGQRTRAVWDAKGATAITYDSTHPGDHDALYLALAYWADLADDPVGWRRAEADRIFAQGPTGATDGDWDRLRWILRTGGGAQLLAEANPTAEWAQPLAQAGLMSDDAAPPADWIRRRMSDPEMPAATLKHVPVDVRAVAMIEHRLMRSRRDEPSFPEHLAKAWRLILASAKQSERSRVSRWHAATRALAEGDISLQVRRELINCLRPTAVPEMPMSWLGCKQGRKTQPRRLRDVIGVRFNPPQLHDLDEVPAMIPKDLRASTLRALEAALEDGLDDAVEYEQPNSPDLSVRSVSRHTQDRYSSGFYPIVRLIIDLWDLFVSDDRAAAVAIADRWRNSVNSLMRRMWLHALSSAAFDGAAVADGILTMSDEDFWDGSFRREVMHLLVERWGDIGPADRMKVEARIADGFPEELEGEQPRDYIEHQIFIRLERLVGSGKIISAPTASTLADIKARHPEWSAGPDERDDFRVWSTGVMTTVGPQGDPHLLAGVGPDLLVAKAAEAAQRDPMRQGEVWRALCEEEPIRALTALEEGLSAGRSEPHEWRQLLYATAQQEDAELHALVARAAFREIPDGTAHAVLDLLLQRRDTTGLTETQFLELWDRLLAELQREGTPVSDELRDDPVFRVLNDAEGKLGNALLNELNRSQRGSERNFAPLPFLTRIEQLIVSPGALGYLGRAAAMNDLAWLDAIDSEWTLANLVPYLSWRDYEMATMCWQVALRNEVPRAPLHNAVLQDLLATAHCADRGRDFDTLPGWLLLPLLWRQVDEGEAYEITTQDARHALARGGDTLRCSAAFWLVSALEELEGDPADRWRDRVGPLFAEVWPQDAALRSSDVSQTLARLPFLTGDAFPEAVDAIVPLVMPLAPWDAVMWFEFEGPGIHRFDDHPVAMLRLMEALFDPENPPRELGEMLTRIAAAKPDLEYGPTFRKMLGWARARWG